MDSHFYRIRIHGPVPRSVNFLFGSTDLDLAGSPDPAGSTDLDPAGSTDPDPAGYTDLNPAVYTDPGPTGYRVFITQNKLFVT